MADTITANSGDTVDVPIRIHNNPGIAALSLNISYDNTMLKLISVEDGKILGTSTFLSGDDLTKIPYILNWDDLASKDNTGNGIVAVLTFEVLAACSGTSIVSVSVNQASTFNVNLEEVEFATVDGGIKIDSQQNVQKGDYNSDDAVTIADAVLLARFLSEDTTLTDEQIGKILNAEPDYDGDGLVTILDVAALLKKLGEA